MKAEDDNAESIEQNPIVSTPFAIGDMVRVECNDEGFAGDTGTITHVFPSGRCMVAIGRITILNLPPEALTHDN